MFKYIYLFLCENEVASLFLWYWINLTDASLNLRVKEINKIICFISYDNIFLADNLHPSTSQAQPCLASDRKWAGAWWGWGGYPHNRDSCCGIQLQKHVNKGIALLSACVSPHLALPPVVLWLHAYSSIPDPSHSSLLFLKRKRKVMFCLQCVVVLLPPPPSSSHFPPALLTSPWHPQCCTLFLKFIIYIPQNEKKLSK